MVSVCNADIFGRSLSYENIDYIPWKVEKMEQHIDKNLYKMLTAVATIVDEK